MTDRTPEPQTADLVKRLRCHVDASDGSEVEMVDEAADAIEELTAALRRVHRYALPITAHDVADDQFARKVLSKYGASNG